MDFEWDTSKADENLRKHKVSFAEAVETFADPNGFALDDVKHSRSEKRYYWIGKSERGRILTTRYTRRREKFGLSDQANGVSSRNCTMKKPSLKNLKINLPETKQVRSAMARQKSVKITINIDSKTLDRVRLIAEESGIPYPRLINRMLNESVSGSETTDSRLERVEKELKQLRRKLAA